MESCGTRLYERLIGESTRRGSGHDSINKPEAAFTNALAY
jgi:hypothetical protein